MTRGAQYRFRIVLTNRATGQPASPALVDDIVLVLHSSTSAEPVATYRLGEGIEADEVGYVLTIAREHTLALPPQGGVGLHGFILPFFRSIKIDLGSMGDNKANPIIEANE